MSADLLLGFGALLISCAAFGFMFAPLKKMDAKDGVFTQWVQCAVVFMAGFVINIARGLPPFNLVASIGGFLYATGNVASVPIIGEMGIGLGMLLWGSVQIIVGWGVAHFGLFGTKAQSVKLPLLNYLGVLLTLLSGIMFVSVYSQGDNAGEEKQKKGGDKKASPSVPLNNTANRRIEVVVEGGDAESRPMGDYGTTTTTNVWAMDSHDGNGTSQPQNETPSPGASKDKELPYGWARALHLTKRKLLFIGLAVCLGSLHGLMMTPIVYVQDTDPNASDNVLDYVFSHFSAVFFFSTLYFFLYSLLKRGKPYVQPGLVLPSMAYGVLWTIGMTLFIMSNQMLSQTVSFPITVRLPAIIGALADVFLFKTIQGKKQLSFLFAAILVGVVGVIMVGISL